MDVPRAPRRPRHLVLALLALALAGLVAVMGEHGVFATVGALAAPAIPGVTVEDDAANAAMPIVTSLRSDGEAQRLGLRVGDRIAAIDGRPVRDAADLRRAIAHASAGPVSLHIRRGDTVWTMAIDRADADPKGREPHDPQDPAG